MSASLRGGRWYAGGAVVHPGRLLRGLATAASAYGTHIAEKTTVRRIGGAGAADGFDVDTSRGRIRARHVVLAANSAARRLAPELAAAIRPQRGQMLATRPAPIVFGPAMAIDWGTVYWRQTQDGAIVLGGRSHMDAARAVAAAFPDLPPLRVARRWAGIMDQTPDGKPIVGRLPGRANRWVVAGFGGHGLPPAIGVGRELAGAIVSGEVPVALARFDPRRFIASREAALAAREAP